MTNFEKIKNMSIDEMAQIVRCPGTDAKCMGSSISCIDCCKQWLESEVEE